MTQPELQCYHLEADTAMLFTYAQFRRNGVTKPAVIDSEDTDVVVLCAFASSKYNGILGLKRKKIIVDCGRLCSPEMTKIIIPLHVISGCDSVSSFYGKGEILYYV